MADIDFETIQHYVTNVVDNKLEDHWVVDELDDTTWTSGDNNVYIIDRGDRVDVTIRLNHFIFYINIDLLDLEEFHWFGDEFGIPCNLGFESNRIGGDKFLEDKDLTQFFKLTYIKTTQGVGNFIEHVLTTIFK